MPENIASFVGKLSPAEKKKLADILKGYDPDWRRGYKISQNPALLSFFPRRAFGRVLMDSIQVLGDVLARGDLRSPAAERLARDDILMRRTLLEKFIVDEEEHGLQNGSGAA